MKTSQTGTLAFIALALLGCGTAAPGTDGEPYGDPSTGANGADVAADDTRGLVYSLQVGLDHQIRFYRHGEVLLFTERAPVGVPMVSQTVQDSSPAGLFAAVRPGEPLPAELAGFEQLSGAAEPSERAEESSIGIGGEPQLVDKHADSSGPHFRDFHKMCPTSLRDMRQSYPASASGCWLNVGGPGATASLATHSQIFVGSYVGNTLLTYTYNGRWVRTDTAVEGQNITIVAWSGKSDDKFLTREHRYDLSGTHRHVGVAYVRAGSARGPLSSTSVVW